MCPTRHQLYLYKYFEYSNYSPSKVTPGLAHHGLGKMLRALEKCSGLWGSAQTLGEVLRAMEKCSDPWGSAQTLGEVLRTLEK